MRFEVVVEMKFFRVSCDESGYGMYWLCRCRVYIMEENEYSRLRNVLKYLINFTLHLLQLKLALQIVVKNASCVNSVDIMSPGTPKSRADQNMS